MFQNLVNPIPQLVIISPRNGGVPADTASREQKDSHFYKWGMNYDKHGAFLKIFQYISILSYKN